MKKAIPNFFTTQRCATKPEKYAVVTTSPRTASQTQYQIFQIHYSSNLWQW